MVKSMTGYGRAEETVNGCTITVELRSVNNRYLDCNIRIPRLYLFAEDSIKSRVQNTISRGKVDVFVTLDGAGAEEVRVSVNRPLAQQYVNALGELAQLCGVSSSTATLSAKMAASVRIRAGSSWVLASTSLIRATA